MKVSVLQQTYNNRRTNSFRDSSIDSSMKSIFWLILHALCCLISLVLGFRFSRLLFFLLFSTNHYTQSHYRTSLTLTSLNKTSFPTIPTSPSVPSSRVVVGRHGILIRPWPHPNPDELMKAHRIMQRVQREQRVQYGVKNPRTLIVVTPTYVRTFQALHLTGVMHSLMNVPYDLVWIVVEAGGKSNETASFIAKSGLRIVHVGFDERMPISWEDRHRLETRMRLRALRLVREEKLDGIVMFADDSNMHSMELFDEIQKVKWIGSVSVGILSHSGRSEEELSVVYKKGDGDRKLPVPVQGPACNSSDQLAGWHTFNSLPYVEKRAKYIGDRAIVLPRELEWAGFVLNSRLVWKEDEDKPEWVKDFETVVGNGEDIESPLFLLNDASMVEPLGSCGRKVMLWWLRVEARADSKFPSGWIIDPPLEVTVPAKRTPWPDVPPELPSSDKVIISVKENTEKHLLNLPKTRPRRSRRSPRNKNKHEARTVDSRVSSRHSVEK